jgi:oxygen-independent coproporphyrinogen-3 oxidase
MEKKSQYVTTVCKEIKQRKDYLKNEPVRTIYFGGGTPSQLTASNFKKIFDQIEDTFDLSFSDNIKATLPIDPDFFEITLEANPDDINPVYLKRIRTLPFNRISLGIQSFHDAELRFLNRRHDSDSAIRAVQECQAYGLENISIDLMYGLPGQTPGSWEDSLQQAIDLNIQHISAYHLIIEEKTPLFRLLEQGKVALPDEEISLQMFGIMINRLTEAGFEHYEISNFGKPDYHSRHNSSYWDGTFYLGTGPSAHSYNGENRLWNKSSIETYCETGGNDYETENITIQSSYNDHILTRLRTKKGIDLQELKVLFGKKFYDYCLNQSRKYIANKSLEEKENCLKLTRQGIFISDGIMSDLMFV